MPIEAIRVLLLVVLALPAAFAVGIALTRSAGLNTTRQMAGLFALIHLVLTITLTAPVVEKLQSRGIDSEAMTFDPMFVPGTKTASALETTWNLMELEPVKPGMPASGIQFYIGLDGLNIWLVLLTSTLGFLAVIASWNTIQNHAHGFYAWIFLLQSAIIGAFVSFDLILFYIFFELTLIPSFFLIGSWGVGSAKRDAARKFFLYTLFGSLFTLAGMIGVVLLNPVPVDQSGAKVQYEVLLDPVGNEIYPKAGPITFNVNHLMKNVRTWSKVHRIKVERLELKQSILAKAVKSSQANRDSNQAAALEAEVQKYQKAIDEASSERDQRHRLLTWLFFAFCLGFIVKIPLVPFHTWLPAAYSEAPAPVVMLFSGLMAKLGAIGLLRLAIPLFPEPVAKYGLLVFGLLGAIGVVYAAFCAYAQSDLKMIAAYSSVSHLGLLALGLFALNPEGLSGAALHMINHGITAGAMFILVGLLADRFRTTDMSHYGGLIGIYPRLAVFTFVICLASVGLPGLNNFVSEMLLIGSLATKENQTLAGHGMIIAAASGIFLSAWYTMTMLRRVFFGSLQTPPMATGQPTPSDLDLREWLCLGIPAFCCIALGLFPQPVLNTMKLDVEVIVRQLDDARNQAPGAPSLRDRH